MFKSLSKYNEPGYFIKQILRSDPNKKIILSHLGFTPTLYLVDAQLIKEFLITKQEYYIKSTRLNEGLILFLDNGLVVSEGSKWKKQRKIISQAFHYDFLKKSIPQIIEIVQENLQGISCMDEVVILDEMNKITGDVVCRMFFGKNFSETILNGKLISLALADLTKDIIIQGRSLRNVILGKYLNTFPLTKLDRKVKNGIKLFQSIALKTIQERKCNLNANSEQRKDLLQLLLESEEHNNNLTEDEIIANFLTFFFAGMDTTAHLVTGLFWFLKKHSEYYLRVNNEIQEFINNIQDINSDSIQDLKLLDACIKETLRLMSPANVLFSRIANQNHSIGEFNVSKGTEVNIPFLELFAEKTVRNQYSYQPDRWINGEMDNIDGFFKIPFSAGPRNCIGQHLALLEAKIITVLFFKLFTYDIIQPQKFEIDNIALVTFKVPFKAKLHKIQH